MKDFLQPSLRTYLYALGVAVVGLLTAYGLIDGFLVEHWQLLLLALFGLTGNGVATIYRPTITRSERDSANEAIRDSIQLESVAAQLVRLHRSDAPDDEIRAAMDVLEAHVI